MFRILAAIALAGSILIPAAASAEMQRNPLPAMQGDARLLEQAIDFSSRPADPSPPPALAAMDTAPMIGAVSVAGADTMGVDALSARYEPFIGQAASSDVLRELASSLAAETRRRGYLFASAVVPAQSVQMGIVRVRLDLGAIDEVRVVGSDNRRLRAILEGLVGPAPLKSRVERQLLLAEDLPGITIGATRYEKKDGKGVLTVEVEDRRWNAYAAVDNYGSDTQGPLRAQVSAEANGLLATGDSLSVQLMNSLERPDHLTYASARYAVTSASGVSLVGVTASGGASHPGGDLGQYDLNGRSAYAAVFASRSLLRTKQASLWANAELAGLKVKEKLAGTPLQRDEIVTLSVGLSGDMEMAKGRLSGGVNLVQGLAASGTNRRGDPLSSRPDASAVFTKETAWINWTAPLGERNSVRISAAGQMTSKPLLASQELALGGPAFGRAYDFSERFGDRGMMGAVELRRDIGAPQLPVRDMQIYGFADGGYAKDLGQGFGGGRLYSAGGGVRGKIGKADFGLEAAAPLNSDRFKTKNRSPRFGVFLRWRF